MAETTIEAGDRVSFYIDNNPQVLVEGIVITPLDINGMIRIQFGEGVVCKYPHGIVAVVKQEPTLQDCPYCAGKHEDVAQCPLAPKRYAVVRSWKTALMPGIAFNTYHQECWPGPETPSLVEADNVRLVPIGEIASYATCSVCHGLIAQPPDIDTRDMWHAHIFP